MPVQARGGGDQPIPSCRYLHTLNGVNFLFCRDSGSVSFRLSTKAYEIPPLREEEEEEEGKAEGEEEEEEEDEDDQMGFFLAGGEECVSAMVAKDDLVIPKSKITVAFSYPLSRPVDFDIEADDPGGFKRGEIAVKIAKIYQHIYNAEADSAPDPGRAGNTWNRGTSDGSYGIWGHGLGDLVLTEMYCTSPSDDCYYHLSVDS